MVLPKGKVLYKNLKTKYVNVEDLVKELRDDRFSGFISVDFDDASGSIIFSSGNVVGAFCDFPCDDPVKELIKRAKRPGIINVYTLPDEIVLVISSVFDGEVIWRDLPASILDFDRFLSYLGDTGFTGVVDLENRKRLVKASIYYYEGVKVETVFEDSADIYTSGIAEERIREIIGLSDTLVSVVRERKDRVGSKVSTLPSIQDISNFLSEIYRNLVLAIGEKAVRLAFRKVFLTLTEKYPFLDPFDPLVYFNESGIFVIDDSVSIYDLVEAMKETFMLLRDEFGDKNYVLVNTYSEYVNKNERIRVFEDAFK